MESLKLMYANLPRVWYKDSRDNYNISEERFNILISKLSSLPSEPITLYIQNGCSILIKEIFDKYRMRGIDFVDYFKSVFDNTSYEISDTSDIIVIYNIGLEKALNTDFSARLLYALIEQIKQKDTHIFLCSHLPVSDFSKKYNIDLVNKIAITKKKERQFI